MFYGISHRPAFAMARFNSCPCCAARWHHSGAAVDMARAQAVWPAGEVQLTPSQARLLSALSASSGPVGREALIDAVWGDREDGGPDTAGNLISVLVHGLRRRLASAGFPGMVRTWPRSGYELVLT
jgi:DNA-binding response OmpR family regulator